MYFKTGASKEGVNVKKNSNHQQGEEKTIMTNVLFNGKLV